MCGLAGFARHPEGSGLKASKRVLATMLLNIEHRGHHATGIACVGGENDFIWKIAQRVSDIHKSGTLQKEIDKLTDGMLAVIGHTRWATLPNAHVDSAAHPFRFGRTVGAHNGMIRNWTELRAKYGKQDADAAGWIVDSEAAFYLLDRFDDPTKAIAQLRGGYSLTWAKDGMIYFVRNTNPLVCAYVRKWKALYWCSERAPMEHALRSVGLSDKDVEYWTPNTDTIYALDPTKFDEDGSHATKTDCPDPNTQKTMTVTKKKKSKTTTSPYDDYEMSPFETRRTIDRSEQETFEQWRTRQPAVVTPPSTKKTAPKTDLVSLINVALDEINRLKGIVEQQQAEITHLFKVCDDAGLFDVEQQQIEYTITDDEQREINEMLETLPDVPTF